MRGCELGDLRGCWRAAVLAVDDAAGIWGRVVPSIAEHCLAGDAASCHALASPIGHRHGAYRDAVALCKRGLGAACHATALAVTRGELLGDADALLDAGCKHGDTDACLDLWRESLTDARKLRAHDRARATAAVQCKAGFNQTCTLFDSSREVAPFETVEGFAALALERAQRGCARGLLPDCLTVAQLADGDLRDDALTVHCATRAIGCRALAELRGTDRLGGRDAMELGCQRGNDELCGKLVRGYRSKLWPEPVAGRGAAIAAWLCTDPRAPVCVAVTR